MLLLASSLVAALLLPAQQDAQAELAAAQRAAFLAWTIDDTAGSIEPLARAVRSAAAELARRGTSAEASALADELEFALIELRGRGVETRDLPRVARLLDGVRIDPAHGDAYARLAWIRADAADGVDTLGMLVDWEFVGPFDNERGIGMETRLAPFAAPEVSAYPGKVREVTWRRTPTIVPYQGVIDLGSLVDPKAQVCVLARCYVHSDEELAATLFIGFQEEARVWVDGALVLDERGERDFAFDAHAVHVGLNEGWTEIAVLVGGRGRDPLFAARLARSATSEPLVLEHSGAVPEGLSPHQLADRADQMPARVLTGVRARLASDESATGLARRAMLERYFATIPRSRHAGRELAVRAYALDPSDVYAAVQRAIALDEGGISAEKDVNPWLHAVDDVLALAPESTWALRLRAYHAGWNQPTLQRALDLVDRALSTSPRSIPALALRATLLDRLEQAPRATVVRRNILELEESLWWPTTRLHCSGVLSSADPRRVDIARAAYEASGDSSALEAWSWHEQIAGNTSGLELLETFARRRLERTPWGIGARLLAVTELIAAEEPDLALDWIAEGLELAPENPQLHKWRARALLAKGDVVNAIASLERELVYDFSAEDERRLLEHLQSVGAEPFHIAHREPLADVLARTPPRAEGEGRSASREVLLSRIVVEVQPDGTAKRYRRLVQRVLTERGARDLDRIPFRAFGNQEVRVLAAEVKRADGRVERAETGRSSWGMVVDLPPLAIGDVVDLEWRIDDLRPTFFGQYFGFNESFAPDASVPTRESEIVLVATPTLPIVYHQRGGAGAPEVTQLENGNTQYRWSLHDIAPIDPEPLMPPPEETVAAVQASTYRSWEAFGSWWWNLIEQEIKVSPEMRAKVAELTRDAETPLAKLQAIYEFVVTDIRYNAWEFGVHGYQPYSAPVIFSRGFGDCKDKAILMKAMLGEVGIEAWPVLIRAEDRRLEEDHALALVEHFNHCIAYVPEQAGIPAMFLDGTARHHPFGLLPTMDAGAEVVVVRGDGVEQLEVPFPTSTENRIDAVFDVALENSGAAHAAVTRRPTGRYDSNDRAHFSGSAEQRSEEAARVFARLFGPTPGKVDAVFSDLDNLREPVEYSFTGSPDRFGRPTDDGFELPAAIVKFEFQRSITSESQRKSDLLLDVPYSAVSTIRYVLPAGAERSGAPPDVAFECEDARYSWRAEESADGWIVHESLEMLTHRVPAARYAEFREFGRLVDAAQSAVFDVEVK